MSENKIHSPDIDKEKLKIDRLNLDGVEVCLINLDHEPSRMPKDNPWSTIEKEVENSSLVFTEYDLTELHKLWNNPLFGEITKKESDDRGITYFATKIAEIAKAKKKDIAVVDIANSYIYEFGYYLGSRTLPIIGTFAGMALNNPEIGVSSAIWSLYAGITGLTERFRYGLFSETAHGWEKYILDPEDARRLIIAEGIRQEAKRRSQDSNSKIVFVAPPAHISRVKMYLENDQHPAVIAKKKAYSFSPGLDKTVRISRYHSENDSWVRLSSAPIQL